MTGFIICTLH